MDIRETAHFISIDHAIITDRYKECIRSFTTLHPYFQVKVWNEKDINDLLSKAGQVNYFNKLTTFINKYNFVKYLILDFYGGWYIDLDIKWKKSIYHLLSDRGISKFPQMIIPVRSLPGTQKVNHNHLDDMLLYSEKNIFGDLIQYSKLRKDIDNTKPYEPFGPISLSKWAKEVSFTREYLYEWEIQKNGIYCDHLGSQSWSIYI